MCVKGKQTVAYLPTNITLKLTFIICNYIYVATYGTAQFKLYIHVQVHVCACTFNVCNTSKTGVCMHCCM